MYAGFLQSHIVECPPGVVETLLVDSKVSRSTSGNGVMEAAGSMGASVRIGYDVCDEEGESEDWKREQVHFW
jgi:hypothetical protein